jgi:hypothetical protein
MKSNDTVAIWREKTVRKEIRLLGEIHILAMYPVVTEMQHCLHHLYTFLSPHSTTSIHFVIRK